MSGRHFGFEVRAERFGQDDRVQEDRRLGYFRLLELFVGSGEHDIGDREAENFVGFFEQFFCKGNVVVQVFAHSDELGALTREYVCVHIFSFSWLTENKDK